MNPAMTSSRVAAPTTSTGSATTLETTTLAPQGRLVPLVGTLRLRAEAPPRRGIRWAEDVVDNEGLGRKSSKVCCIYHKARAVGESSSEEDSDSESESESDSDGDSEPDNSTARMAKGSKRDQHKHERGEDCEHDHEHSSTIRKKSPKKKARRKKSPNAYEKMPKRGGTMTETMK